MKKTLLIIPLILVSISSFAIIFHCKDDVRNHYPYTGLTTYTSGQDSLMDAAEIPDDVSLSEVISLTDTVIEGYFTGTPELVKIPIIPEEGTNEYSVLQSLAKQFDKPFIEMVPQHEYYKCQFTPSSASINTLSQSTTNTINIYVSKPWWELFPNPETYQHVVLFGYNFPYGGENSFTTTTVGYYYVTDDNIVMSAESFEGLDKYSGETLSDFVDTIHSLNTSAE